MTLSQTRLIRHQGRRRWHLVRLFRENNGVGLVEIQDGVALACVSLQVGSADNVHMGYRTVVFEVLGRVTNRVSC